MLQLLRSEESLSLYVSSEPAGGDDPWVAFLLPEEAPLSAAGEAMSVAYAWLECQGYLVFAPRPPRSQSGFVTAAWAWLAQQGLRPSGPLRPYLAWVGDPDADADAFAADVVEVGVTPNGMGQVEASADLMLGKNYLLALYPHVVVGLADGDGDEPAITLNSSAGLAFAANGSVLVSADEATIPLTGAERGCVKVGGSLLVSGPAGLDENRLDLAIRYFAPGATPRFRYPLFFLANRSRSLALEAVLDPNRPTDPQRTSFRFAPQPPLASWLRTARGQEVTLQPQPGARLLLTALELPTAGPPLLYAVPDGPFAAAVPTAGSGPPELICGRSGTEALSLPPAAAVVFAAGSPALASFDPTATAAHATADYLDPASGLRTAWVSVAAPEQVVYRAQPQQAPLFAAPAPAAGLAGGSGPSLLTPRPLQVWPDPARPPAQSTPTPPLPIAPLAGVPPTADEGEFAAYEALEARVLSLARRRLLLSSSVGLGGRGGPAERLGAGSFWTTEPHGMLVEVDAASQRLERVRLGVSPSAAIRARRAAVSGGEQPGSQPQALELARIDGDPLLALQGERAFLLATRQGLIGGTELALEGGIELNGWSFEPRLPLDTADPLPATATVLIVKLGGDTIAELAERLGSWQDRSLYNASPSATQELVQATIARARADVAAHGEASLYAGFVALVDDASWNGALVLNAGIGEVPAAVEDVLIGIPRDRFVAFHLAVQTSDVAVEGGSLSMARSAVSALVDYENPTPGKGVVMDAEGSHGFLVNYLRAVFENSSLHSFACQVGLELDELFGLGLTVHGGGDPPPPNLMILDGVYQAHDDDPTSGGGSYSFTGLPATRFDFGYQGLGGVTLRVLESLTVTKIQLAPVARDATTVVSGFTFWGSLAFGAVPGLDVFNYDALAFSGLALLMRAPAPGTGPQVPSFELATAGTGFDPTAVPGASEPGANRVRPGGLVGSLPLSVAKLLDDPGGLTLGGLGFDLLQLVADNTPSASEASRERVTALVFDLPLGGAGALAPPAPLTAQLLAGWTPKGELLLGLALLSLGDGSQLRLEEVLRLGLGDAALDVVDLVAGEAATKTVALKIEGVSLRLLGKALPKPPLGLTFTILAPQPGAGVLWSAHYPLSGTKAAPLAAAQGVAR